MKKFILLVLLLAGLAYSQQAVISRPYVWEWSTIADDANVTTSYTTSAVSSKKYWGNQTLWIKFGTVDSIKSDITVKLQLYNSKTDGWAEYQGDGTLFTISSGDVTAGSEYYYKLTDYDAWAWADSCRFNISVSSASYFNISVYLGGQ